LVVEWGSVKHFKRILQQKEKAWLVILLVAVKVDGIVGISTPGKCGSRGSNVLPTISPGGENAESPIECNLNGTPII